VLDKERINLSMFGTENDEKKERKRERWKERQREKASKGKWASKLYKNNAHNDTTSSTLHQNKTWGEEMKRSRRKEERRKEKKKKEERKYKNYTSTISTSTC